MGVVNRGEVWWVDLGQPVGSEPGFRRPVVVISSDRFNASRIKTVIVAAITSNLKLGEAPGNVMIGLGEAGLDRPSVINVSQIVTTDRNQLVECVGRVERSTLRKVDDGIRLVLNV